LKKGERQRNLIRTGKIEIRVKCIFNDAVNLSKMYVCVYV
jgi:hypothetical protein